jgi:hypothetical protein
MIRGVEEGSSKTPPPPQEMSGTTWKKVFLDKF